MVLDFIASTASLLFKYRISEKSEGKEIIYGGVIFSVFIFLISLYVIYEKDADTLSIVIFMMIIIEFNRK